MLSARSHLSSRRTWLHFSAGKTSPSKRKTSDGATQLSGAGKQIRFRAGYLHFYGISNSYLQLRAQAPTGALNHLGLRPSAYCLRAVTIKKPDICPFRWSSYCFTGPVAVAKGITAIVILNTLKHHPKFRVQKPFIRDAVLLQSLNENRNLPLILSIANNASVFQHSLRNVLF